MAFLQKSDLNLAMLVDELDEITRADDALVTMACAGAEAEMRGWLFDTFDVDAIFAATGSNRNALLVQFGADIAVYALVARLQAGQDADDRKQRYDRAIAWLKAVAKTEEYVDLPRRTLTKQTHITFGGADRRRPRY